MARTPGQREADLLAISRMHLEGLSSREIAARLSSERDYSLSHTSILTDLRTILGRWQTEQTANLDRALTLQLAKLDRVEAEAWHAWRRSLEDAVTEVSESDGTGRTTRAGQSGDPRLLAIVEKCIARRASLLGLEDHVLRLKIDELELLLGVDHGEEL